jgi:urease accessory protein
MSTDVLTLMQWLSPGFPVGAFAYSHGLEQAIDSGTLTDAQDLQDWLEDLLEAGGARADVVLLARAYSSHDPDTVDTDARAFAASVERLTETLDQGTAFARTVDAIWQTRIGARCYPVAVGLAARERGLPLDLVAVMYAQAFAANLVSAAVRLVPLGQTEGQRVLAALAPHVETCARNALTEDAPLFSNCIAADIAAMRHETQYSKVFRT